MTLNEITDSIKETLERHGCLRTHDEVCGEIYVMAGSHLSQIIELAYKSGQCSGLPRLEAVR